MLKKRVIILENSWKSFGIFLWKLCGHPDIGIWEDS